MQDNVPCRTAFHRGKVRKAQQIGVWWAVRMLAVEGGRNPRARTEACRSSSYVVANKGRAFAEHRSMEALAKPVTGIE
jgi:hypothetical protein